MIQKVDLLLFTIQCNYNRGIFGIMGHTHRLIKCSVYLFNGAYGYKKLNLATYISLFRTYEHATF